MIRRILYWIPVISIILTPADTLRGFITPITGKYAAYFHGMYVGLQIYVIVDYIIKGII